MSRELHISPDRSLPIDAATQTFAFIARKGAGKTYAAGKLVEELLNARVQCVVLDTVGNWYGLRLAANGKDKGFDVPVFGGLRGDIPLTPQSGELVADIVADTARSIVIDASQFSMADRKRFATAFGERLWKKKKSESHPSPLMLVIEESQLIIPQKVDGSSAHMVGIFEEIVRLGRNYGIGCTMITQRPQSVNKEVLNQTECLFVGQVNGAHERKSLREWITTQGMDTKLVDELPSLPVGTMYIWSPQWLGILQKIRIGKKTTLDASATPKVGDKSVRRDPAPLDLGEIEQRMASIVEEKKRTDPRALQAEVNRLKGALQKAEGRHAPLEKRHTEIKKVEVPVFKKGEFERIENLESRMIKLWREFKEALDKLQVTLNSKGSAALHPNKELLAAHSREEPKPVVTSRERFVDVYGEGAAKRGDVAAPSGGIKRMMIALAQRPGLSARQLGIRSGLSSRSGTFGTYLSTMRKNGWLVGDKHRMELTSAGIEALGNDYVMLPEGRELYEHWRKQLGDSGASRMLQALFEAYPEPLSKSELGVRADISSASGTFGTYLSTLRTLQLVQDDGGDLKATDEFFQ